MGKGSPLDCAGSPGKLCKQKLFNKALQAVDHMDQQGHNIIVDRFYHLLQNCIYKKDLATGREVQFLIVQSGYQSNAFLGSHLIRLFALCGSLLEANQVFNKILQPNVFTWCAIISAYGRLGKGEQAIKLYHEMQKSNVKPDDYVIDAVLKACASVAALDQGKLVHACMIDLGIELDVFTGSTLIDMYGKCGSLEDAQNVFNKLPKQNVVIWSAIIAAYAQPGHGQEALQLVKKMQEAGMEPNNFLFPSILKACSSIASLAEGKQIHAHIIKSGDELDVYVGTALIDMYAKCGSLKDACKIFHKVPKRSVLTWGAMIDGFTQHGYGQEVLRLFQQMQEEGVETDNITFTSILKACSGITALDQGKLIHACIYESEFEPDVYVWNTVIDMYAKFGNLEDAHSVFNNLVNGDAVSWSALISGYAQCGCGEEALQLFYLMRQVEMEPTDVTFISVLKACSCIPASEIGKLIHAHLIKCGLETDVCVGSTLIDMYAKCGNLQDAQSVFKKLPNDNVVVWSAMIGGCAQLSTYELALHYFKYMQQAGLKPNDVTYSCLLSSCSHMVCREEACYYFQSMAEEYDIIPTPEHYNCMVDLLGRAGYLNNAEDLLWSMPIQPNVMGWTSLLNYCKIHGTVELGRRCFDCLIKIDCSYASGYVLMSNIYRDSGMWEDVDKIQELRKYACAWKKPGKSFIQVDQKLQSFKVGDNYHPEANKIFAKLNRLFVQGKEAGHVPQVDSLLQSILDDSEEDGLYGLT